MEARERSVLPVAVIGAGPVGLAAAAHLVARGETPLVLESGDAVGAGVRGWAHVRTFSPWKYMVDGVAGGMLEATGWTRPDGEAAPTGGELVRDYLEPLAALPALAPHLRLGRKVTAVTRAGRDKVKDAGRAESEFVVVSRGADGREERHRVRAVIDASGTWTTPSPMGADGLPAEGEAEAADRFVYGIPDVRGADRARYAGKRTLVVGSGHSAFNALLDLAALSVQVPGTEVVWAVRREDGARLWGGEAKDALPARGALGTRLRNVVESGAVRLVTGFRAIRVARVEGALVVHGEGGAAIGPVDEVVVATGFRPDLDMLREVRLSLDPALECPAALGPLIDPNVHSCGTVYPHGAAELAHPEAGFYVVGMKSYGRAPTFLLLTGYEQVRSVVAKLTGDEAGARAVELVLPETGVCSTDAGGGGGCCGPEAAEATAGAASCAAPEPAPAVSAAPAGRGLPVLGAGSCCG